MQNKQLWRVIAVGFCVLVFFFALHAKTAVYNNGAPVKLSPSTSSKLWPSGEKMQSRPSVVDNGVLLWMAAFCLLQPYFGRGPRVRRVFIVPHTSNLPLRHLHRFLRPPPVLA